MGSYLHNQDEIGWESIRNELEHINLNFINAKLIIGGDFNEKFTRMVRLGKKMELNISELGFSREGP
jgi:hypothetical protein